MAKTSIILMKKGYPNRRLFLPTEVPTPETSDLTPSLIQVRTPNFIKAHSVESQPANFTSDGGIKLGKMQKRWLPDTINAYNHHFEVGPASTGYQIKPHRKGKVVTAAAFVIQPEDTEALDELDRAIETLRAERDEFVKVACKRGRLLKRADCAEKK